MTDLTPTQTKAQHRANVERVLREATARYEALKYGRAPMADRKAARLEVEKAQRFLSALPRRVTV